MKSTISVRSSKIDRPITPQNPYEPLEHRIAEDAPREISPFGEAKLDPVMRQVVDRPDTIPLDVNGYSPEGILIGDARMTEDKAWLLAFMEEPVTIRMHEARTPEDEDIFAIWVNGRAEMFKRGETKTVKRYYVERLLTAKVTTYKQKKIFDAQTGMHNYQEVPHTVLRHNFSVTHDANPHAASWLAHLQAQS